MDVGELFSEALLVEDLLWGASLMLDHVVGHDDLVVARLFAASITVVLFALIALMDAQIIVQLHHGLE